MSGAHCYIRILCAKQIVSDKSFNSIFTVTVLQHIVDTRERKRILREFRRLLSDKGVLLSIEWAEGQRNLDWCTAVGKSELKRWFNVASSGEVVESGRRHTIGVCTSL
ncbi:MAG: hypothetical protein C4326_07190 [Ignavibacteria bacterium]